MIIEIIETNYTDGSGKAYVAKSPELPHNMGYGDTEEEAVKFFFVAYRWYLSKK